MFDLDETGTLILEIGIVVLTTITAGCMSGLTLSLFSLDETYLKALAEGPPGKDQRRAQRVLSVTSSPHWLLVTLLLTNAAAVESMPLIIDELLNPIAAIAISVVLVLVFGEVIPQALFVRHALIIGSFFAYPIKGLMVLTAPVSFSIAALLDAVVGHREAVFFRRRELREFLLLQRDMMMVDMHSPLLPPSEQGGSPASQHHNPALNAEETSSRLKITDQEISIMLGALSLSETMASDVMKTRIEEVVSLGMDDTITRSVCERLFTCGFSRIPIHEASGNRKRIVGYLVVKTLIPLIFKSEDRAPKVRDLAILEPLRCFEYDMLSSVYQKLQSKSCHIATVEDEEGNALGIVTAHDILEHIHRKSFVDETDLRQGAPMQLIMKSWTEMQWKRQYNPAGPGSPGGGGYSGANNVLRSGPLSGYYNQNQSMMGAGRSASQAMKRVNSLNRATYMPEVDNPRSSGSGNPTPNASFPRSYPVRSAVGRSSGRGAPPSLTTPDSKSNAVSMTTFRNPAEATKSNQQSTGGYGSI